MSNKEKIRDIIPVEVIATKILLVRGQKVILDKDLAELYGVPTKRLNEQVKRNIKRFPEDFMFQFTKQEFDNLRCQIGTSSLRSQFATSKRGGRRYLPYAFTEQGVAMLSSVLNSDRAIQVNIAIMRAFVRIREVLSTHREILKKIEEHDKQITVIFEMIKKFFSFPREKKLQIGFKP